MGCENCELQKVCDVFNGEVPDQDFIDAQEILPLPDFYRLIEVIESLPEDDEESKLIVDSTGCEGAINQKSSYDPLGICGGVVKVIMNNEELNTK